MENKEICGVCGKSGAHIRLRDGAVLYGRFDPGEKVSLIDGEKLTNITLDDVSGPGIAGEAGGAGLEAALYVSQKGLVASPGCLIVKD